MQQVRIDFDNPGLPQSLGVVEGESQSRIFQAALYKSGAAYTAPAGAVYSIMYRGFGPQNQGWYDTIEDGAGKRAACTVSGNVVTCELARQALRVPGHLTVVLCVSDAKGYMLKSWPIMADVRNDGYEDTGEIEMYFNLSGLAGNYFTQLEKAMDDAEAAKNNLISTSTQVQKDIDAKAAETLKTIPESYTELDGSVKQLKEDLDETLQYIPTVERVEKGYYDATNGAFTSNGAFRAVKLTCKSGDKFKVTAYIGGSSAIALCVFLDASGKYIDRYGWKANQKFSDEIVTVPNNENISFACFQNGYGDNIDFRVSKFGSNGKYIPKCKGKYFSIMGDSISTFEGYIPSGYNNVYNGVYGEVTVVEDTWWYKTILALQGKLGVCNAGGSSTVAGDSNYKMSSDARTNRLGFQLNGVYTRPDIIIIEGGINDFTEFPVGTYDCKSPIPAYPCIDFKSAYACMLNKIKIEYPLAEIYCCTLFVGGKTTFSFPITNKFGDSLEDYNNAIRDVAALFGAKVIDFSTCGLTYYSNSKYTANDGRLYEDLHPNVNGMSLLANECIKTIEPGCNVRFNYNYKLD